MKEEISSVLLSRPVLSNERNGTTTFFQPVVQPRLQINQPYDAYEREADAAAESVIQSSLPPTDFFRPAAAVIQMRTTAASDYGVAAPTSVNEVVNSRGKSLDPATSGYMQSRFGQDFRDVQVHDDSLAHESSKAIGALAYTHNNHLVFGAGQYHPETKTGQHLIAHELTHVVQQAANSGAAAPSVMRKATPIDEFKSCNASQQNLIQSAINDARAAVHRASSVLGSAIGQPNKMNQTHRNLLVRDFHTTGIDDMKTIFGKYNSLGRALDSGIEVECEPVCDKVAGGGVVAGYAYNTQAWGGHGPLHMCFDKQGFDFAAAPQNKRVQLIIHEGSHRFTGTDDKAYSSFPATSNYSSLSADDAMDNADSYALFASSL